MFRERGKNYSVDEWVREMAENDCVQWPCDGNMADTGDLLRILAQKIVELEEKIDA